MEQDEVLFHFSISRKSPSIEGLLFVYLTFLKVQGKPNPKFKDSFICKIFV
jgi:hypothetical protein